VTLELARRVAARVGALDGAVAVTLGGAWTRVQDAKVDLLYRDLRLVDRVLDDCLAGRTTCAYQPGHPHGFHSHSYAGDVHHGLALHDPAGALAGRRSRTSPYPPALRREVVRRYLWEADFAVTTARGAAGRGDLAYVSGCLFRAVACLVQVLFALNERWFVNEKGAVGEATGFPRTPPGFAAGVDAALGGLRPEPGPAGGGPRGHGGPDGHGPGTVRWVTSLDLHRLQMMPGSFGGGPTWPG
jgi:hypothetical protein